MGNVKFDNFRWNSNQDPHWDERHETVELPITNPATGLNYVTENSPIFIFQSIFTPEQYAEYQLLYPDEYAKLPYGAESLLFKLQFNYTDNLDNPQIWEMPGYIDTTQYSYGHWILGRYTVESTLYGETPPHADHTDYFTYLAGSNVDPILEAQLGNHAGDQFLPIVILMQDKVWYDKDPQSQLCLTTNKMLKKLSIKGKDIKAKFLEQEADESNTDNQAEKWDFYLHFAAPVYTKVSETVAYLFEFFSQAAAVSQFTFNDYQRYLTTTNSAWPFYWYYSGDSHYYKEAQPITTMRITEGTVTGFDVLFGWSYIYKRIFEGQFIDSRIGNWVGQDRQLAPLKPGKASVQLYQRLERNELIYREGLDQMHDSVPRIGRASDENDGYHDYVIFTKQFALYDNTGNVTSYYHERILVMALSQEYTINTRTEAEGYAMRNVDIGLFDRDNGDRPTNAMRIPLHVLTLKNMSLLKREAIVADSLCYTVFLVHKQKVKWYETGFFKIFIIIIAVILIIIVAYYGLYDIAVGIAAAVFNSSAPLLIFVLYSVLAFAVGTIIGMAGQAIGGIWGVAFTIVASIIVAGKPGPSSLPGSWGNAMNYLNTVKPYLEGVQQIYAYYVNDNLQREWETFMLTAREKERQLEEAWGNLDSPSWLEPMDLVRIHQYTAESPREFMYRALNTNPGVTANNMVHNFPKIALTLPKSPLETNAIQAMFQGFQEQTGAV